MVLGPDAQNDRPQGRILLRASGAPRGIPLLGFVPKVRRRSDRHHGTDRLDPVDRSMVVNEPDHHFARRSSSAWAKYADAFFRISFARLSSRFSRSNSFSRWRSSVVRPARWPVSRSAWRTHRRSVSDVHTSLPAIDAIAAHWEAC